MGISQVSHGYFCTHQLQQDGTVWGSRVWIPWFLTDAESLEKGLNGQGNFNKSSTDPYFIIFEFLFVILITS